MRKLVAVCCMLWCLVAGAGEVELQRVELASDSSLLENAVKRACREFESYEPNDFFCSVVVFATQQKPLYRKIYVVDVCFYKKDYFVRIPAPVGYGIDGYEGYVKCAGRIVPVAVAPGAECVLARDAEDVEVIEVADMDTIGGDEDYMMVMRMMVCENTADRFGLE